MFDRRVACALMAVVLAASIASGAQAAAPLGVGHTARPQDVKKASITVFPDGAGLPPGQGTVAQGRALYLERCAACHGAKGEGNDDYPALAGGRGSLRSKAPILTVGSYWPYATTLWDYIRRAMPYPQPGSLTPDEVYALTAYVLHLNGIVDERTTLDRQSLPRIHMPNRDGFASDPRPDFHRSK